MQQRWFRVGVVAAGVAFSAAGLGVVFGQAPGGNVIGACVSKGLLGLGAGSIRIVASSSACLATEEALSWNQQGNPGVFGVEATVLATQR